MHTVELIEHTDTILEVKLNRPDIHNAFDDQMIAELNQTWESLKSDDAVRVIILSAAGKSFSAGADLNWMRRMADYSEEENYQDSMALAQCMHGLANLPMTVIAKVQGAAYGGGVGLVACCDIAIATSRASFCLSEVKLGLIPAVISPYVIEAIGKRAAQRVFLTAERFKADKALQMGLISEVVSDSDFDSSVMSTAQAIAKNGPNAVRKAKQLIKDVSGKTINQKLMHHTAKTIAEVRSSEEGQEGVSAFLGKRKPDWLEQEDV